MRSRCTGSQPAERRFACGGIDIHLQEYVLYILAGRLTYSRYKGMHKTKCCDVDIYCDADDVLQYNLMKSESKDTTDKASLSHFHKH